MKKLLLAILGKRIFAIDRLTGGDQVSRAASVLLVFFLAANATGQATKRAKPPDSLAQTVKSFQDSLKWAHRRLSALEALDHSNIKLDPAVLEKYSRIDSDTGTFLMSLQDVEPYLDGHKVSINVGNPGSGTYRGFSFTATWGKRQPETDETSKGFDKLIAWNESLTSKEFTFPSELQAGAWNRVEIIITGSQSGFGYLGIRSLKTDTISLRAAPNPTK